MYTYYKARTLLLIFKLTITCKCKILVGIGRTLSQGVKVINFLKIYITIVWNQTEQNTES